MGAQTRLVKELVTRCFQGSAHQRVPRGALFFGPPGTGKTLIARAVAQELNAHLVVLNGGEVMGRFVGQAEAKINEAFQEADKHQPAIIFVDEIDALCPSRGSSSSSSSEDPVHARIVSLFLQRFDELHQPSSSDSVKQRKVAVFAATNRIDALDHALRRPGRFDREVAVGAPSEQDRAEILELHLARVPHRVSLPEIALVARDLHGFVGADILALCREASWGALRRCRQSAPSSTPGEAELVLTAEDLLDAQRRIRPSALRELTVQVPHVAWSDVGGQEVVKQQLKEAIEWPLERPEVFERMGIKPPQGVLLYGPPGCSKTLLAKAIASQGKMNFIAVKGPELLSKWVGESERAVQQVFAKARMATPAVVFFDEIDALASSRGTSGSGGGVADRVLSQLLLEMDGIEQRQRVIVVAATNRPDVLDSALMRPGRLDRLAYVPPPDAAARAEILRIHTRSMPLTPEVSLEDIAQRLTQGYSGAEVAALCREAAMQALQDSMEASTVCPEHFERAARTITPQITDAMLKFFQNFEESRKHK
jgi:AAA family ATPase